MKTALQLLLLLIPFSAFSNNNEPDSLGSISGSVFTADGQPAASVTIQVKNTNKGSITDAAGKFNFKKIKAGTYIISVTLLGYDPTEVLVQVRPAETAHLKLQLQVTYHELAEVIVKSNTGSKYVETQTSDGLKVNLPLIEIPQNIIVTTNQLLADQGLLSLSEVIRNVSGVQKTYGGLNDYSLNIRGTDATFNVFRNGMSGYWWNQQEDAAMIEKIEFIKGPAGYMNSIAQPGGFVNIETKQPVKERNANINAGFGSFNLLRLTTDLGGPLDKKEKITYRFNSGIHYQERAFQFSKASRLFACVALKYEPNTKTSITIEYNFMKGRTSGNNDGLPSIDGELFSLPRNFTVADQHSDRLTASDQYYRLQIKHSFNERWRLSAQMAYVHGYWGGYLLHADDYIPVSNDTLYRYSEFEDWRSYSGVVQANVDGKFYTGRGLEHKVLFGVDICYAGFNGVYGYTRGEKKFGIYLPKPQYDINIDSLRDMTISDPYKEKHGWASLYFQDHIKIAKKLIVTLAARYIYFYHDINNVVEDPTAEEYEKHSNINKVTPRAGLTWLFSDNMSVYVLYDKSFWPQFGKSLERKAFEPLTGYNTEIGFKGFLCDRKLGYNFSLFHIVRNNTLTPDPLDNNYFVQRGQVTSSGIDIDITGEITPALTINTNYEYVDARTTKDSDPNVVGVKNLGTPSHSANLWLRYNWWKGKLKGFSFAAGYQYMGKQSAVWYHNPDPETRFFPAYNLLDAALSYSNQRFSIGFNVYNITNSRYAANGYFGQLNEWRYTPGDPIHFRLNVGVSLLRQKKIKS